MLIELKLKSEQKKSLLEILKKRHSLPLVKLKGEKIKTNLMLIRDLQDLVADELCEVGLQDNDEPNSKGLFLESLIDSIGISSDG